MVASVVSSVNPSLRMQSRRCAVLYVSLRRHQRMDRHTELRVFSFAIDSPECCARAAGVYRIARSAR